MDSPYMVPLSQLSSASRLITAVMPSVRGKPELKLLLDVAAYCIVPTAWVCGVGLPLLGCCGLVDCVNSNASVRDSPSDESKTNKKQNKQIPAAAYLGFGSATTDLG